MSTRVYCGQNYLETYSGFKMNLRVLKEVDNGSKFCVCHLDTVIISMSPVLGSFWEINEPRYLILVLKRYNVETDYSIRVFIFKKHMV